MAFPAAAAPGDRHKEGAEWHVYDGAKWWRLVDCTIAADAAERAALTANQGRTNGSLCVQEDNRSLWVWDNTASNWCLAGTGFAVVADVTARDALAATAVENGMLVAAADTGSVYARVGGAWVQAWTAPADETILRKLVLDPERGMGTKLDWRDDRHEFVVRANLADLYTIPSSHLATGKLAYVTGDRTLFEFISSPTTATNTIADWEPVGEDLPEFARVGDLPQPSATDAVKEGKFALVRFHADGVTPLNKIFVARKLTGGSSAVTWTPIAPDIFSKPTRASADVADPLPGDLQITTEAGHKEIKQWDQTAGSWADIYKEDDVRNWIAAGNNFVGTVQESGGSVANAIDSASMPSQATLTATQKGHYWIWVGAAGHVITPNEVGGASSSIEGSALNKGDWIIVSEPSAGIFRYTVVPGDLLSKSRGDSIYGMATWAAGAYETGSIVVHQGKLYRSVRAVVSGDVSPDTAGAPWAVIQLSAGVLSVAADANLPATAPAGDLYLVINSARGGNRPSLQVYDIPTAGWVVLGGSGGGGGGGAALPLALTGGHPVHEVGAPVGSIMIWPADTAPTGWLICNGATFDSTLYAELRTVLGRAALPDLRNMFVRGGSSTLDKGFSHNQWTTGMPRAPWSMDRQGDHKHTVQRATRGANPDGSGTPEWTSVHIADSTDPTYRSPGDVSMSTNGEHTHNVIGGDIETAPDHVVMHYIIKATPSTMLMD